MSRSLSRRAAACALACLPWLGGAAHAHLLPAQTATMNIVDKAAFFVVAVPVSALKDVDLDRNGLLSLAEIDQGRAGISAQFAARFRLTSDGQAGSAALSWVLPPDDTAAESPYVVILHRLDFSAAPVHPVLSTDLFGSQPGEALLTLTATRGKDSEVAILRPGAATHEFFRSRWPVIVAFVAVALLVLGGLYSLRAAAAR